MQVNLHLLKARVTIELQDHTGKPVAWLKSSAEVGAGDKADVAANVERLAVYVARAVETELRKALDGSLLLLDIKDVERRNAIGAYLRARAKEVIGKSFYHPEHTLNAWADEIDPSTEELARRSTKLAASGLQGRALVEKIKATLAENGYAAAPAQTSEALNPEGKQ